VVNGTLARSTAAAEDVPESVHSERASAPATLDDTEKIRLSCSFMTTS